MPHGYDESYLEDFRCNMGNMFEYAALDCAVDLDIFFRRATDEWRGASHRVGRPALSGRALGLRVGGYGALLLGLCAGELPSRA